MTWVLVIVAFQINIANGVYTKLPPSVITTQEFSSEAKCEAAANVITAELIPELTANIRTICVKK